MSPPKLCKCAQAGGEFTTATGPYVLLQMRPVGMVQLTVEAAEQLRTELTDAIKQANDLRHRHSQVPIRWRE